MGWDPISILQDAVASKMKERLGNREQDQVISNTTSTCKKNVSFEKSTGQRVIEKIVSGKEEKESYLEVARRGIVGDNAH